MDVIWQFINLASLIGIISLIVYVVKRRKADS